MQRDEYHFGEFHLKKNLCLKKDSNIIFIPPKELLVLSYLVENAGKIVAKEEIINVAWGGGMVSDESLTRCIYVIRKLLREDKQTKYINTLYGKGYVFSYPLSTAHTKEHKSDNYVKSVVIVSDGLSRDFNFSAVHYALSQYIPAEISLFPTIIEKNDSADVFFEKKKPDYAFYCSASDSCAEELFIKAFACDSKTGITLGSLSLKDDSIIRNFSLKENIRSLLCSLNKKRNKNDNEVTGRAKNVEGLMNMYNTESLLQAANLILAKARHDDDDIVGMLQVAECYFGIFINENIKYKYKAIYKMKALAENVLFSDPLNPTALAIMGLVKVLNHEYALSNFYFSQARKLSGNKNNTDVDFYYACYLYFRTDLDVAMELVRSIESNGEKSGRTKLLKKLILNYRHMKLTDDYFVNWENNVSGKIVMQKGYKKNHHTVFSENGGDGSNVIVLEPNGNKNFTARIGELKRVTTLSVDIKDELHWL